MSESDSYLYPQGGSPHERLIAELPTCRFANPIVQVCCKTAHPLSDLSLKLKQFKCYNHKGDDKWMSKRA